MTRNWHERVNRSFRPEKGSREDARYNVIVAIYCDYHYF